MSKGLLEELAQQKELLDAEELACARQVAARINLAQGLRAVEIDSLGQASLDSYFVLLKLSLAYSAADAMKTLDASWNVKVIDPSMQQALAKGTFEALLVHLRLNSDRQKNSNSKELAGFGPGQANEELITLVKHCRHVVFHASAAPKTIGLAASKQRRALLLGLANATLSAVESTFRNWLRAKVAK